MPLRSAPRPSAGPIRKNPEPSRNSPSGRPETGDVQAVPSGCRYAYNLGDIGSIVGIAMDLSRPMRVVTPTLDGDVLVVLAGTDAPLTGRQVHLLLGRASEAGVRQALGRLVEQGIVVRSPAGRAHLYRLNREHLAAPHVIALAGLRAALIERLRGELAGWGVRPALAVLFGSAARRESDEWSDLDLLVVRPAGIHADDPRWRAQVDELARRAHAWTGNDAEVLEYGEEELPARLAAEPVLAAAARDGVALAGSLSRLRAGPSERTPRSARAGP